MAGPLRLLVTGATGYVGGRLVSRLLAAGHHVRVMVRDPSRLEGRPWLGEVEVVGGDALEPATLAPALDGIDAAYYLIHSMQGGDAFHERDLTAARNVAHAAHAAGVGRLIYLGGLGDPDADLSEHLRSRQQTGDALREAGVPVTEFRAAVIVGSGSVSFEMIRYLTERIPIMVCPQWVFTRIQPIAVDDVLAYLAAALSAPDSAGEIVEIGGADVLTYGEMMLGYADVRGLRRVLLPVPVLTPRLSAYWVHWMTPIPASIARPLIEGLRNEVIVRGDKARRLFPDIDPVDYRTAVERALGHLASGNVETAWSDALTSSLGDEAPVVLETREGMIIERRQQTVDASPGAVYRSFAGLGGERGWLTFNWAWRLRGMMDRLVGGVGFRRGRRHPDTVRMGDAVDFWRVEEVRPGRLLRLRAEMKVPGRAWLQFEANPLNDGGTRLVQTAFFAPKGLAGLAYWYILYPIHGMIFSRLVRAVAHRAEKVVVTPLKEFNFGPTAISYIRGELSRGMTLSKLLLDDLKLEQGKVIAYLPETVTEEVALKFKVGGIGRIRTEWILPAYISNHLTNSGNPYVVFEYPWARPSDPYLQNEVHHFFTCGIEIYYFLNSHEVTEEKIEQAIKWSRAYPTIGMLTSLPEGVSIQNRQDVSRQLLSILADRTVELIVGAYDNGNELIWKSEASGTEI